MKIVRLAELLFRLRNELGKRAKKEYAQLFGKSAIRRLSDIVKLLEADGRFTDGTLFQITNNDLVILFKEAGIAPRKVVHDSVESLAEIRDIVSELNRAANQGKFGSSHELAYLTNSVKEWLSKDIEHMEAIIANNLKPKKEGK